MWLRLCKFNSLATTLSFTVHILNVADKSEFLILGLALNKEDMLLEPSSTSSSAISILITFNRLGSRVASLVIPSDESGGTISSRDRASSLVTDGSDGS